MAEVYDQTNGIDYSTLSAAISGSSANDVLLVPAGSYDENFPAITHSLTIDAVGGMASLTIPQPVPLNGRAILDVPFDAGVNLSISGLEISGATRPEPNPNGAGILFETGNGLLTVTNSYIHNNEDGILTGGPDAASPGGVMSVVISHSQISNNGAPPGQFVRRDRRRSQHLCRCAHQLHAHQQLRHRRARLRARSQKPGTDERHYRQPHPGWPAGAVQL